MLGPVERLQHERGPESGHTPRRWRHWLVAVALALPFAPSGAVAGSGAGVPPNYGHDFVTVGAPGNRAMLPVERYFNSNQFGNTVNVGAVDYAFRIARTEVTSTQWLDFVRVAWPAWEAQGWDPTYSEFRGSNIIENGVFSPNYIMFPGRDNWGTRASWRAAAMYCNWLHNGRPTGPNAPMSAFLTGAYDIATFTRNPDGSYNDQAAHSADARYWIPTLHEWTKAGYYDPNRYSPGNPGPTQNPNGGPPITGETGGYWLFPNTSQVFPPSSQYTPVEGNVGLHPEVQSPWGVLDMIGTVDEWTETIPLPPRFPWANRERFVRGSDTLGPFNDEFFTYFPPDGPIAGIRIASLVPTPGVTMLCVLAPAIHVRARRRRPA